MASKTRKERKQEAIHLLGYYETAIPTFPYLSFGIAGQFSKEKERKFHLVSPLLFFSNSFGGETRRDTTSKGLGPAPRRLNLKEEKLMSRHGN